MSFKGGGGQFKPTKKTPAPAKPTKGVGPVPGKAYGQMVQAAKKKTAAKPVTQLQKRVGPTAKPNNRTPVRKATDRAVKTNAAEKAKAEDTVRRALAVYKNPGDKKAAAQMPAAADVRDAIRKGYGKVGGAHLLQRKAELVENDNGDISLKMDRRYLPDTTTPVMPGDYKPGRKYTTNELKNIVERGRQYSEASDSIHAAGAKALEITARPIHAVAAGTKAAMDGKNVAKAAREGISGKDKTLFSDVLKDAGAPGVVAAVGGFGLDVALDPTTYVTGGTGAVVRKSAQKAALDAEKRALKAGLTKTQAAKMGQRAAEQTAKKLEGKDAKGLTVKVAGREVPGVRRATGNTVGKAAAKAGRAAGRTRAGQSVKNVIADVSPKVRPAGVTDEQAHLAEAASRTARGKLAQDMTKVQQQAVALQKKLGAKNYQKVIDAIEAGKINDLSGELREAAVFYRSQMRYANRLRKQAGIKGGERSNYVTHALAEPLEKGKGVTTQAGGAGKRTISPSSSKARKDTRTLAEIRKTDPGKYSEDLPLLYANRMTEGYSSARQAELNRRLAEAGTTVKPGKAITMAEKGESVYHIKGSNIAKLDAKDAGRLADGKLPGGGGRYVVLNDATVDNALAAYRAAPSSAYGVGRGWDRVQGTWKRVAIATPGFHVRNLIGDTQNAYLAQPGHKLVGNIRHSAKALKQLNRHEDSFRSLDRHLDPSQKGLKIKGEKVTYAELAQEAAEVGAIRSGFISREIPELTGQTTTSIKKVRTTKAGQAASNAARKGKRLMQNREDVLRLATYIGGRQKGLSPERAAARTMQYHFDYAQLTPFERNVARRIMPFYTWSARNIPLQAKSLVTKPGKFANYEKVREESAKAQGLDPTGYQNDLSEWEQRNLGIPVKIGGKTETLSFGTPIADLNELPGFKGFSDQSTEWAEKLAGLTTPLLKNPVELLFNYSFFFRDQIQRDDAPLVAAPDWVGKLPGTARKQLGVVKGIDKRTGDSVYKWPGKINNLAKTIPGLAIQAQNLTSSGTDRRGRGDTEKWAGFAGFNLVPMDPVTNRINSLYDDLDEVNQSAARLRQQEHKGKAISADNPTREYRKALDEARQIQIEIYKLSKERGDSVPYGQAPPKGRQGRKSSLGGFGGGGSSLGNMGGSSLGGGF